MRETVLVAGEFGHRLPVPALVLVRGHQLPQHRQCPTAQAEGRAQGGNRQTGHPAFDARVPEVVERPRIFGGGGQRGRGVGEVVEPGRARRSPHHQGHLTERLILPGRPHLPQRARHIPGVQGFPGGAERGGRGPGGAAIPA